jgi:hypothetical protein
MNGTKASVPVAEMNTVRWKVSPVQLFIQTVGGGNVFIRAASRELSHSAVPTTGWLRRVTWRRL